MCNFDNLATFSLRNIITIFKMTKLYDNYLTEADQIKS